MTTNDPIMGNPWVIGEPEGEMFTDTEILARLSCSGNPWAHLRLTESDWCHIIEDGDTGMPCYEQIVGYVVLPKKGNHDIN